MIRPHRPGPGYRPTVPPATVVRFKCGHTKPIKEFLGCNCSTCRFEKAAAKRNRNSERKPARLALESFRYPCTVKFHDMEFNGEVYRAAVEFLGHSLERYQVVASSYVKLGEVVKKVWLGLQKENARPAVPKSSGTG